METYSLVVILILLEFVETNSAPELMHIAAYARTIRSTGRIRDATFVLTISSVRKIKKCHIYLLLWQRHHAALLENVILKGRGFRLIIHCVDHKRMHEIHSILISFQLSFDYL